MARLWPFGNHKITRRELFKGATAVVASGVAAKLLVDAFSRLEEPSPASATSAAQASRSTGEGHVIDVSEFKRTMTVEKLIKTSEDYFAARTSWDSLLAKPLSQIEDTPDLLNNFAHVLTGLQLLPGMTVLDFGAGSCWASRWLTQLGMEAIALDVSQTALKIGQALYARQPVFGDRPRPRFLIFDGRRIALANASVDRILCLDTFHHLLNPDEVLREMSRVLKPGGIAGFSEPGPRHSRTAQSQFEMRNFKVLEDDIHVPEIWSSAERAGFVRMKLAVFSPRPLLMSLPEFEDYLNGGAANQRLAEMTRAQMQDRRVFFLQKGGEAPPLDSRSRAGLAATLEVKLASATVQAGTPLVAQVIVTNSGRATWLPASSKVGAVRLGCHLLDASGKMLAVDYFRQALTPGDGLPIAPGKTVKLETRIPSPPEGSYVLEFDLVSESVGWFAMSGSEIVRRTIQVT